MNGTEIVTIYYVSCIHCKHELEINRKPPAENVATRFGIAWTVDIVCRACNTKAHYGPPTSWVTENLNDSFFDYDDVRKRHEPSAEALERSSFTA